MYSSSFPFPDLSEFTVSSGCQALLGCPMASRCERYHLYLMAPLVSVWSSHQMCRFSSFRPRYPFYVFSPFLLNFECAHPLFNRDLELA